RSRGTGRPSSDRPGNARRRHSAFGAGPRAVARARRLVRAPAAGHAADHADEFALRALAPDHGGGGACAGHARRRSAGGRAPARKGVRRARRLHHRRHPRDIPGPGHAARQRRQVLLPPARRRELVRRDPAAAQPDRSAAPRLRGRAGAGRGPPGDRELLPLPARMHGRGADPGYRPPGRRAQLLGHHLRPGTRRARPALPPGGGQHGTASARGGCAGHRGGRRARRSEMSRASAPASRRAPRARTLTAALLRRWPLPSSPDGGGKEERGRALVVGGQRALAGAVRLAGEAALRAGAGKLQLAVAAGAAPALAIAVPEARVLALPESSDGSIASGGRHLRAAAARADALVLGPGMESSAAMRALALRLLPCPGGPVVLDAGAIDLRLLRAWHRLRDRPAAIVTPHHGEMAALLGCDAADVAAHAARMAAGFARGWRLAGGPEGGRSWVGA